MQLWVWRTAVLLEGGAAIACTRVWSAGARTGTPHEGLEICGVVERTLAEGGGDG